MINRDLKKIKKRIQECGILPTGLEIRKFLDDHKLGERPKEYLRSAKDEAVHYLVEQLDQNQPVCQVRSLLNTKRDTERSLALEVIDQQLWASLALMLACGADLDPSVRLNKITDGLWPYDLDTRRATLGHIDLCTLPTFAKDAEEQYFTMQYSNWSTAFNPQVHKHHLGWVHELQRGMMPWKNNAEPDALRSSSIYIPSTNVSHM